MLKPQWPGRKATNTVVTLRETYKAQNSSTSSKNLRPPRKCKVNPAWNMISEYMTQTIPVTNALLFCHRKDREQLNLWLKRVNSLKCQAFLRTHWYRIQKHTFNRNWNDGKNPQAFLRGRCFQRWANLRLSITRHYQWPIDLIPGNYKSLTSRPESTTLSA